MSTKIREAYRLPLADLPEVLKALHDVCDDVVPAVMDDLVAQLFASYRFNAEEREARVRPRSLSIAASGWTLAQFVREFLHEARHESPIVEERSPKFDLTAQVNLYLSGDSVLACLPLIRREAIREALVGVLDRYPDVTEDEVLGSNVEPVVWRYRNLHFPTSKDIAPILLERGGQRLGLTSVEDAVTLLDSPDDVPVSSERREKMIAALAEFDRTRGNTDHYDPLGEARAWSDAMTKHFGPAWVKPSSDVEA